MAEKKYITLGSGDVYISKFNGTAIPTDAELEIEDNKIGETKNGASISYKANFYEASSDNGVAKEKFMTSEEASMKFGAITWNGSVFDKLCQTARIETSTDGKKRTAKIGGIKNYDDSSYVVRFVHKSTTKGNKRITIVGSNEAGFEITFAADKETILNPEFKAFPIDSEGTLIIYEEDIITSGTGGNP